jgi:3-dehydroquinate dehydratase
MADRGGDLMKIVAVTRDVDDTLALLRANAELAARIDRPFTLMPVGAGARRSRFVLPLLGSVWAFGQVRRVPGGFDQMPLVRELRAVFDAVRDVDPDPATAAPAVESGAADA